MLGNISALQGQNSQQNHQQQNHQQQGPQGHQGAPQAPPPPPINGQDLNLSNILHYLQLEWRRYERERNEWEIERAEMRARIALLEGERRSFENTRIDLLRRIKMLEFALRMERSKQLNQSLSQTGANSKAPITGQAKDDSNIPREGSNSSSPRSEDVPLPENRLSIASLSSLPNGGPVHGQKERPHTWAGANFPPTSTAGVSLGKPPLGRDPKSRARSREYLKQCLQEISYLTSPQAMNPLPNRPLLTNPALPLTLPNVPPFDQMAYNGRPRKIVPEVGKDFPVLNGMPIMTGPASAPASGSQIPLLERDSRSNATQGLALHPAHTQQTQTISTSASYLQQQQQQPPSLSIQTLQQSASQSNEPESTTSIESSEPQLQTAIFRPGSEWKEQLERARQEKSGQLGTSASGASAWDTGAKEEDESKEEDQEVEDDDVSSTVSEDDGKLWRPRRTLRNHLDSVRAISFHPTELCLASGGDDFSVKIWRMDVAGLATPLSRATTDIEPQLTLRGHTAPITALVHSPAKRLIYSASLDASIRVWVLPPASHTTYAPFDASRARGELIGHTAAVWGLALIRDESVLISCGAEGTVHVWNVGAMSGLGPLKLKWGYYGLDSEEEEGTRNLTPGATVLEAVKSDLKKVAVGYQNGVVKVFDVDNGRQLVCLRHDSSSENAELSQANAITSHPTMPMLVTGHEDKHIRIWDIASGQCTHSMLAHVDAITSLSIDAAGFSLVSGGNDCSLRFWDLLGTRACIQETTSHREKGREGVLAVEFHSSLPFMASAGADGVLKLYASS